MTPTRQQTSLPSRVATGQPSATVIAGPAPRANWQSVASFSNGSYFVAVVNGGGIYTSPDLGQTWMKTAASLQAWMSVACSSSGNVTVAAAKGAYIYTSCDFGQTWKQQGSNSEWVSVASSSTGSLLVAAAKDSYFYISYDSGRSWTTRAPHFGNAPWQSAAVSCDGSTIWAVMTATFSSSGPNPYAPKNVANGYIALSKGMNRFSSLS